MRSRIESLWATLSRAKVRWAGAALAFALVVALGVLGELPSASAQTPPSVDTVSADNITKTDARVTVTLANYGSSSLTVHVRVRIGDTMEGFTRSESTSTGTAEFNWMTFLVAGTTYHVEASLDRNFETGVILYSFTTDPADFTVTNLTVGSIADTTAVATITTSSQTMAVRFVGLRIRPVGIEQWERLSFHSFTPDAIDVELDNLVPGTE